MLLMPPTMTIATATAMKMPSSHALSLKKLSAAPVTSMRMAAAWLDWNMLPIPRQPKTMAAA